MRHLEACFMPRKTPLKLTALVLSNTSMSVSNRSCVCSWKQMPALFTCSRTYPLQGQDLAQVDYRLTFVAHAGAYVATAGGARPAACKFAT